MGRVFTVKTVLTDYFQGAIGETKLRELIRKKEIPHARLGSRIVFREESLDAWLVYQEKQLAALDLSQYSQLPHLPLFPRRAGKGQHGQV